MNNKGGKTLKTFVWISAENSASDFIATLVQETKSGAYFQDPVLFSGSMRMNLDPFEQYTDRKPDSATSYDTLIKKKIKFSLYIRKIRWDLLQNHMTNGLLKYD